MNHKLILKSLKLLALVLACFALAPVAQAQPAVRSGIFLGPLEQIWAKDVVRAVLLARWYWERLPEEELVQEAAKVRSQLNEIEIKKRIGQLPWFGSGSGVPNFDPIHASFITTMNTIRMYRGDPPASLEQVQLAVAVLLKHTDPVNALLDATPASDRQVVAMQIEMVQAMGGDQLFRFQVLVDAASALPRDQIPVLIPELQR